MLIIAVPLVVLVIGLLVYAFAAPPTKVLGLIAYAVGLFFAVAWVAKQALRL